MRSVCYGLLVRAPSTALPVMSNAQAPSAWQLGQTQIVRAAATSMHSPERLLCVGPRLAQPCQACMRGHRMGIRRTCAAAGRKQARAPPVRLPCDTRPGPGGASSSVGVAGSDLLMAPGAARGVAGGECDFPASPASCMLHATSAQPYECGGYKAPGHCRRGRLRLARAPGSVSGGGSDVPA